MANLINGFTRVKSLFRSGINLNNYDDIVNCTLNAEVGTLPKDMLGKILTGTNAISANEKISIAKKGFSDAIEPLLHDIEVNQRAQSIFLHKFLSKTFTKEKVISLDFLKEFKFSKLINFGKEANNPKLLGGNEASIELTKAFSQIIPNCSKVNIVSLQKGSFGAGYKLEFLDSTGNKVLHDKVLKVFYRKGMTGSDLIEKNAPIYTKYIEECFSTMTKRDIVTLFNNIKSKIDTLTPEDVMAIIKPFKDELAKNNINIDIPPEEISKFLSMAKNIKLKNLKEVFKILETSKQGNMDANFAIELMKKSFAKEHGVIAEANTASYIRNRVGHCLSKTDIVIPDYYDLRKGYSIAEFSDDLLPKSESKMDFSLLGLEHNDLHRGNTVAGRIVDIGGIVSTDIRLQDKITLRYYKKIMNQKNPKCRQQYIRTLNREMEQMNFLDAGKVQDAITIAMNKLGLQYA